MTEDNDILTIKNLVKDAPYHPMTEEIVDMIEAKANNYNSRGFFRNMVMFQWAQIASNMRAVISQPNEEDLTINTYVVNLMTSGGGKNQSLNFLEDYITRDFVDIFKNCTYPEIAELSIQQEALENALQKGLSQAEAVHLQEPIRKEYNNCGAFLYKFDSGTGAAYKQLRTKCQIAGIGALSFVCDEIGNNFKNNEELFNAYLESYDVGKGSSKLVKNTSDANRTKERYSNVPCNMLLFGTPDALFDSSFTEKAFKDLLNTGMSRRCFFGLGETVPHSNVTVDQMFKQRYGVKLDTSSSHIRDALKTLAAIKNHNKKITISETLLKSLALPYEKWCLYRASQYPELGNSITQLLQKEIQHRAFKVLKLAGAIAFINDDDEITQEAYLAACKVAEDSGKAFYDMLHRPEPYIKLAKFISSTGGRVYESTLVENLPFFKAANSMDKKSLLQLAMSWATENNLPIKKCDNEGVPFYESIQIEETNVDDLIFTASTGISHGYEQPAIGKRTLSSLVKLGSMDGVHWCNHRFIIDSANVQLGPHRSENTTLSGFNLVVFDVDGKNGVASPIPEAISMLDGYTYIIYTTKSHTEQLPCYRVILPLKYTISLNREDYKGFMKNLEKVLPFKGSDEQTYHRSRKWLSNNGTVYSNLDGQLFDPLPYMPDTAQNTKREKEFKELNLKEATTIERWFLARIKVGSRNHELYKYGMLLCDRNLDFDTIVNAIQSLNSKLEEPLGEQELRDTIFKSVQNKIASR